MKLTSITGVKQRKVEWTRGEGLKSGTGPQKGRGSATRPLVCLFPTKVMSRQHRLIRVFAGGGGVGTTPFVSCELKPCFHHLVTECNCFPLVQRKQHLHNPCPVICRRPVHSRREGTDIRYQISARYRSIWVSSKQLRYEVGQPVAFLEP